MKPTALLLIIILISSCTNSNNTGDQKKDQKVEQKTESQKPKVSFTFDDGITRNIVDYKFEDWNQMILAALKKENIKSVFFVTGANKRDKKGKFLLNSWDQEGHKIANHTFTHPNFNNKKFTQIDFEHELLQTDTVISKYSNYLKLFRFPYLKEGKTEERIQGFRNTLAQHGYQNGHVTIDASDWYVNSELIKSIKQDGYPNPKTEKYKAFYLQHILDRSNYYEKLAFELTNRHIHHTLLLHHNLTSALFLTDLIEQYKAAGWEIVDAEVAFQDEIFKEVPPTIPAGESIIWSLAKASGQYENELRYPAEDSRYEIPKMEALGL